MLSVTADLPLTVGPTARCHLDLVVNAGLNVSLPLPCTHTPYTRNQNLYHNPQETHMPTSVPSAGQKKKLHCPLFIILMPSATRHRSTKLSLYMLETPFSYVFYICFSCMCYLSWNMSTYVQNLHVCKKTGRKGHNVWILSQMRFLGTELFSLSFFCNYSFFPFFFKKNYIYLCVYVLGHAHLSHAEGPKTNSQGSALIFQQVPLLNTPLACSLLHKF